MIEKIHDHLRRTEETLALAESCTGGALAARFTALPGASDYFIGSVVAYSNGMKMDLLDVESTTLLRSGAVSRETANEMLLGLMKKTGSDLGIAVTGIAGPAGASVEKPVGTVYIACGRKGKKPRVEQYTFSGDRAAVIEQATESAISLLLDVLEIADFF